MSNAKRLTVTEFDFDDIKSNLKTFMKNQSEFTDYDFEGSGLSALLDVLAYNTHYLGWNMNMLANEMFLDTSILRSSVVSHAKTLGYEPTSARAAKATISIEITTTTNTATMPDGYVFTTTIDGTNYQFVTVDSVTGYNIGGKIIFQDIPIYEGTRIKQSFTVDTNDPNQRFLLEDNRIDTSTLRVQVQTSASDSTLTTYTKTTDITQVSDTSTSYWLQEVDGGRFEIYFGDDVVGKALVDGNIVILTAMSTNKSDGNGASDFAASGTIGGETVTNVTTINAASGGAEPESIKSVKTNAVLDFASQGRCVTTNDYKLYAKKLFPNTQSVQVWGGENGSYDTSLGVVSTPEYGKVFISIKSTTGNNLTSTEKQNLIGDLERYKVASITPVIVDPDITKVILTVKYKYNSSLTTKTSTELTSDILTNIRNYNNNDLVNFGSPFRHSEVSGIIDNTNPAILSNITNINLTTNIAPTTLGASQFYNIYFNNALYNPHTGHNSDHGGILSSTGFKISGDTTNVYYFDDDGSGNLRTYRLEGTSRVIKDSVAGTINYSTGEIKINSINIISIEKVDGEDSTVIRLSVIPDSRDIIPVRNQILEIDFINSTIVGEIDTIATGDTGSSGTYVTNSGYSTNTAF